MEPSQNDLQSQNTFEESLDLLTADDIAPKRKSGSKRRIFDTVIWAVAFFALFSVFVFCTLQVVLNITNYNSAQQSYEDIANEFSPVTAKAETPLKLKVLKASLPLASAEDILDGVAIYRPIEPETSFSRPILNPGGNSDSDPSSKPTEPPASSSGTSDNIPTVSEDSSSKNTSPLPVSSNEEFSSPVSPSEHPSDDPTSSFIEPPPPQDDPYMSEERFLSFKESLIALRKKYGNDDIFAWIYIPGTNINYPVVIGPDNDYYLHRDLYKYEDPYSAGTLYVDYRNDTNLFKNSYTIIYGHNIRSTGIMFNRLLEFLDEKMFNKYRYIYIYTEQAVFKYEIFSAFVDDGKNLPPVGITEGARFLSAIQKLQDLSLHQRKGLKLAETDHVLTLFTCASTTFNTDRCMVSAVLVDYTTE